MLSEVIQEKAKYGLPDLALIDPDKKLKSLIKEALKEYFCTKGNSFNGRARCC